MNKIVDLIEKYPNDADLGMEVRNRKESFISDDINLQNLIESGKEMSDLLKKENDSYLRLYADFENYKKRSAKEMNDNIDRVKINTLSAVFDLNNEISYVLNNIQNEEDRKGVDLIISKLSKFLSKNNIEEITMDTYDPDVHEVISKVGEGNKIVDVVSKGYSMNGKIIRYPKVVIG